MIRIRYAFSTCLNFYSKNQFKHTIQEKEILKSFNFKLNHPLAHLIRQYNEIIEQKQNGHTFDNDALNKFETLNNKLFEEAKHQDCVLIIDIMVHFNILNYELWKIVFDNLSLTLHTLEYGTLDKCLSKCINYLYRFRSAKPLGEQYYFEEKEIVAILKDYQFDRIFRNLKYNSMHGNANQFMSCITHLIFIHSKFSRAQGTDYQQYQKFIQSSVHQIQEQLQELNQSNQFQLYSILKDLNEEQQLTIKVQLLQQLQQFNFTNSQIHQILTIWKDIGSFDQIIFEKIKPNLLEQLQEYENLSLLISTSFSIVCAKISDPEIIQAIQLSILKNQNQTLTNFQNQSLHLLLKIIKYRLPNQFILNSLYQDTIQGCSGNKIRCSEGIGHFHKNQKSFKSKQELLLIQQIKSYLSRNSLLKLKFYEDHKICLYVADLGVIFDDKYKVAFEISGLNYWRQGNLTGKKQLKKEILQYDGWLPIFINSTEKQFFQKLSFSHQNILLDERINTYIREVEQQLGIALIK